MKDNLESRVESAPDFADIAIIGGGIIGALTAFFLTSMQPRLKVVLFERSRSLGDGSTGHSASCFRMQFTQPFNVRLCQLSSRLFLNEITGLLGFNPLVSVGYLWLKQTHEQFEQAKQQAIAHRGWGVTVEVLSPEQVKERFPFIDAAKISGAAFSPQAGFIKSPAEITKAAVEAAQGRGASVFTNTEVFKIDSEGDEVRRVHTSLGDTTVKTVVNAAGAWSGAVAASAGAHLPVKPSPRQLSYAEAVPEIPLYSCPMIIVPGGAYLRPTEKRLLVGDAPGEAAYGFSLKYDERIALQTITMLANLIPSLADAGIHPADLGLYEVSPDGNALIGPDIKIKGLYHCAGFSGHGIMQAPGAALLISELIVFDRVSSMPSDIFSGLSTERLKSRLFLRETEII